MSETKITLASEIGWVESIRPDHLNVRVLHDGISLLCEVDKIEHLYPADSGHVKDVVVEVDSKGVAVFHGRLIPDLPAWKICVERFKQPLNVA
jgi:hypothetical protein